MFRTHPAFRDPRMMLFGLSLFSQANPNLERQLEVFANALEATRNSLSVIRGEMKNFETSLKAVAQPDPPPFTTQPVHLPAMEQPAAAYTDADCQQTPDTYQPVAGTMQVADPIAEAKERLVRFMEEKPDKLQDFLDELEALIQKYREVKIS
ncbi:hypothetical protein Desca_1988 [Desulfotomaculum nigrificans CO-1-SRB]|uniref:Uncharacterized protein n=1 Tax=Desulfotomaculum nigrificans (strain DSM 14880 / VKM B-2319 / CO-1-SRB) TaxID=868595 RepID=F6B957_DESCC|nr:hypothetical protein [Desulfotomaculum nigrificans]AEF94829.1 hypothetical protein Desca_1988 [Desulfotomaculum nigrificans CO-1-SRB]